MKLSNFRFSSFILILLLILNNQAFSQQSELKKDISDGWHRWLQIGGITATLFAAGCGTDLLNRHKGDPWTIDTYKNISMNTHRNVHAFASATALGLYLSSGWELYRINQKRKALQFRHKAHNTLFVSTIAGLITTGTFGFLSSKAYHDGNDSDGQKYADAMKTISVTTLALGFTDIALFGWHDNASIVGLKIRF